MTRKILSLNVKRKKVAKQVDEAVKGVPQCDPQKRFSSGVAINPHQCIRLELGSKELSM